MWTVWIRDQTARSVQSDLDLHSPQELFVSSTVRKTYYYYYVYSNFIFQKVTKLLIGSMK